MKFVLELETKAKIVRPVVPLVEQVYYLSLVVSLLFWLSPLVRRRSGLYWVGIRVREGSGQSVTQVDFYWLELRRFFDELSPEANFFPCEILTTFFTSRFLVAENHNRFQYPGILKGEVFGTFSNPQKRRGK